MQKRATLTLALLLFCPGSAIMGQQASQPLTNAAIIKLVDAGLGEDTVISMVDTQPVRFSLAPDDIIMLKKAGVSEKVIAAMLNNTPGGLPQAKPSDGKIPVYVDANSSTDFASSGSAHRGLFGGVSTRVSGTQYEHSQVPEVIKTIGERCPSVTVTMDKERAYFLLSIEHESAAVKGPVRRRNHVTVVNRDGDVVFSKNDRELGNSIKDACASMQLTPQQISAYDAAIARAEEAAAKASRAQTANQAATTQATDMLAPVQPPSQALAVTTPQEEPLGDVARRVRAQKSEMQCRTLAEANYMIGQDETLVGDKVCKKVSTKVTQSQANAPRPPIRVSKATALPVDTQMDNAPTVQTKPLTNADVVGMVKAGLEESTIVLAIQRGATGFDTAPQTLISLKNQGVPKKVLDAMLTPTLPAGPEEKGPLASGLSPAFKEIGTRAFDAVNRLRPEDGALSYEPRKLDAEKALDEADEKATTKEDKDALLVLTSLKIFTDSVHDYRMQPPNLDRPHEFDDYLKGWSQCGKEAHSIFSGAPIVPGQERSCHELTELAVGRTPTPTPPDMQTIRKVTLDFGASDRLVKAVEKRTCLQVVGPASGAEATLRLSETGGMLPGNKLELLDNSGNLIWSKKAHMPPFEALSDALGCPH